MNLTKLLKTVKLRYKIKQAAAKMDVLRKLGDPKKYSVDELEALSHNAGSKKREGIRASILPEIFGTTNGLKSTNKPNGLGGVLSDATSGLTGYSANMLDTLAKDRAVRRWANAELQRRKLK